MADSLVVMTLPWMIRACLLFGIASRFATTAEAQGAAGSNISLPALSQNTSAAQAAGLHFATPPYPWSATFDADIRRFMTVYRTNTGASLDTSTLQLLPPLPVYTVAPRVFINGERLQSPPPAMYLYPVEVSGNILAVAMVQVDQSPLSAHVAGVNFGAFRELAWLATKQLPSLPHVKAGAYEVRVLLSPGIRLVALWLKSGAGGGDLIYLYSPPLPSTPEMSDAHIYPMDVFMKVIQPYALEMTPPVLIPGATPAIHG